MDDAGARSTTTSLAEALAALKAARSLSEGAIVEPREPRSAAERFEAATRALRAAIRDNPMDVRIREALAELHRAETATGAATTKRGGD